LGFSTRPIRDTLRDTIADFIQRGLITSKRFHQEDEHLLDRLHLHTKP
jgi:hypothetical protein